MSSATVNYDESLVGDYTLPSPFRCEDGTVVSTQAVWREIRRPELLHLFSRYVYGPTPNVNETAEYFVERVDLDCDGPAVHQTIRINFPRLQKSFALQVWIPENATQPVPAFLGLHFRPEELTTDRWPIDTIISRGYALATACYHDLEPDNRHGWESGFRAALPFSTWGAIGVWAWGLSRALDYLETDNAIDGERVAVVGHSRLGKTALWAGAQDERFALVISNNSGCGGASLTRRHFGETIDVITTAFPHWFCPNFASFRARVDELPVDQHLLLSLIAPRPLYVASAAEDLWADPRGEWLSCVAASPVWELFGLHGLGSHAETIENEAIGETIGYHRRSGKHDVTLFDWEQFLDFADRHIKKT
jgi:hypothetical protein